jgi:hypothetical protein
MGTKIVAIAAGNSLPLAVSVDSASPAECQLVEDVLAGSFIDKLPARLIGDKAYDSDTLDEKLAGEYGIEVIAPTRASENARWAIAAPISKTMEGRTAFCLNAYLPSSRHSTGILRREFPRLRSTCPPPYDAQTFRRAVLEWKDFIITYAIVELSRPKIQIGSLKEYLENRTATKSSTSV